jgi:hypothetical protein
MAVPDFSQCAAEYFDTTYGTTDVGEGFAQLNSTQDWTAMMDAVKTAWAGAGYGTLVEDRDLLHAFFAKKEGYTWP